jgi:hypothetical protein
MNENTFDISVKTGDFKDDDGNVVVVGRTYEIKEVTSMMSNLHGIVVWTHSGASYQIGSNCQVTTTEIR